MGQIDLRASGFQHLPFISMGQLVLYVKHLLVRQLRAAHFPENITASWLVRKRGEKSNYHEAGQSPGEEGISVIYLLAFTCRTIHQSLKSTRRTAMATAVPDRAILFT